MKIEEYDVFNLERSVRYAGLAFAGSYESVKQPKMDTLLKLGKAPVGSGHDCFLKGIIVPHIITAPQEFFMQWQRYHFHDIVTSSSKRHSIQRFDFSVLLDNCGFKYVEELNNMQTRLLNGEDVKQQLIAMLPCSFPLTAHVVSNYLQLKTIYYQRKNHESKHWKEYCEWIKKLPCMEGWLNV